MLNQFFGYLRIHLQVCDGEALSKSLPFVEIFSLDLLVEGYFYYERSVNKQSLHKNEE
jgi:hypothetical protein